MRGFEDLVREEGAGALALESRLFRARATARDLVRQVFEKVFGALPSFRGDSRRTR